MLVEAKANFAIATSSVIPPGPLLIVCFWREMLECRARIYGEAAKARSTSWTLFRLVDNHVDINAVNTHVRMEHDIKCTRLMLVSPWGSIYEAPDYQTLALS